MAFGFWAFGVLLVSREDVVLMALARSHGEDFDFLPCSLSGISSLPGINSIRVKLPGRKDLQRLRPPLHMEWSMDSN